VLGPAEEVILLFVLGGSEEARDRGNFVETDEVGDGDEAI
jgi:hypothetical protein